MRHFHLKVLLPACVLPALLVGCSGSDSPSSDPSTDPSVGVSTGSDGAPSDEPTQVGALVKPCEADVKVSGPVTGSWTGKGEVRLRNASDTGDGPLAMYVSQHGKFQLTIYSKGPGFDKAATLAIKGDGYTTSPDVTTQVGLAAASSGRRADVDVDLTGPDGGDPSRLQATFTCGKKKGA